MKTEKNTLGQNIKSIRERRNITSQAIATLLDISLSGYSKIERGETDPQWTRVIKLAEILQVSLDELQNYEHSKPLAQYTIGTINQRRRKWACRTSHAINRKRSKCISQRTN